MDSSSLLYKVFGERSDVSGDISAAARALLQRKASTVASIEYLSQCHATINQVPQEPTIAAAVASLKREITTTAKALLVQEQLVFQSQEEDLYSSAHGSNKLPVSQLYRSMDALSQPFISDILAETPVSEAVMILGPAFGLIASEFRQINETGRLHKTDTGRLFQRLAKLTSHPTGIVAFSNLLGNEISVASGSTGREYQARSILAPLFELTSTFAHASRYFGTIPQYPNCSQQELDSLTNQLRQVFPPYQEQIHVFLKKVLSSKENNGQPKELVLNWIAQALVLNESRPNLNHLDPMYGQMMSMLSTEGFFLNLHKVLLLLCAPFLDVASGRHNMIHPRYCQMSFRLDYTTQPKLTKSPLFSVNGIDEKIQRGIFPFISDIFFLTLHSFHVGFASSLTTYQKITTALHQQKTYIQQQSAELGDAWTTSPAGQQAQSVLLKLYSDCDGYDAHLYVSRKLLKKLVNTMAHQLFQQRMEPSMLESNLKFSTLAMFWLVDFVKTTDDRALIESVFAALPEYAVKDISNFVLFISRTRPRLLVTMNLKVLMEFAITLLAEPSLVRSPIIRAKLAQILFELNFHTKPAAPGNNPGGFGFSFNSMNQQVNPLALDSSDKLLISRLFSTQYNPHSIDSFLAGVFQIYSDVDVVEGLDVDKENFDKYGIRQSICSMMNNLWSNKEYHDAICKLVNDVEGQRRELAKKFLGTLLNDAIMLLEDSLGRLVDVRQLQLAMDNVTEWNAQTPEKRRERQMYYKGQERSSRAFLTLATTTLDFLLNLTKDVSAPFVQVPETKQRLSAMLLHFFEILCGPRCIDLKVKNPEKYAFNPKDLLGKIASIALSFSHYEEIQEIMANDIDYNAAVMQKAHHFLTREKILPAKDCQQFNDFINALDMIGKLRSRQEQEQHSNMDVDQSTIPLQASADDPMDVDHEVAEALEKEYMWRMTEEVGVFGDGDMKDEAGRYRHHYAQNINETAGSFSKVKMQRLTQECDMLANSLPISRASSIFVRTDEDRLDVMKALIVGPRETPYGGGCFIFDIYFPPTYPNDPPLVNLETTGNGTVRFNPNLYNCGKVCLSLLGTWHGDANSKWNPQASNLHQVLVSIQALILVEHPYFNEPSYEAQRGTAEGDQRSKEYNETLQYNTIRYAMIEQLRTPPPEFENVIKMHFLLERDNILKQCESWLQASTATGKPKFARLVDELKKELAKL